MRLFFLTWLVGAADLFVIITHRYFTHCYPVMAKTFDEVVASVPQVNRWKLDKEIDFEHRNAEGDVTPKHLGRIADSMTDWEGDIADHLDLSDIDRNDIRERNREPKLQR